MSATMLPSEDCSFASWTDDLFESAEVDEKLTPNQSDSSLGGSTHLRIPKKDDDSYYAARFARLAARSNQPKKKWHHDGAQRLKKNQKAAVFLEWLVQTFQLQQHSRGYACMECGTKKDVANDSSTLFRSGFHVVDVAGGRGQLAFYLAAFYTVPVSVIDPVVMNLTRFEVQFAKKQAAVRRIKLAEMNTPAATSNPSPQSSCILCQPSASNPDPSSSTVDINNASEIFHSLATKPVPWLSHLRHYRSLFPSSIGLSLHKNHGPSQPYKGFSRRSTTSPNDDSSDEEEVEDCDHDHSLAEVDSLLPSSPASVESSLLSIELASTLSTCSLLYGMHSDGATEALVDYALTHDKDFAVVPCCVFPSAAPHRRVKRSTVNYQTDEKHLGARKLRSTTATASFVSDYAAVVPPSFNSISAASADDDWIPVRTYDEFIAYLQAKHPSIQRIDLAFEGRNTVLFRKRSGPVDVVKMAGAAVSPATLYRDALHSIFKFLELKEFAQAVRVNSIWYAGGRSMKSNFELKYREPLSVLTQSPLRLQIDRLTILPTIDVNDSLLLRAQMSHLTVLKMTIPVSIPLALPPHLEELSIGCVDHFDLAETKFNEWVLDCIQAIVANSSHLVKLHLNLMNTAGQMDCPSQILQSLSSLTDIKLPVQFDFFQQIDLIATMPKIRYWDPSRNLSAYHLQRLVDGAETGTGTGSSRLQLEDIGFYFNEVDDAMAAQLTRLPTLTRLNIDSLALVDSSKLLASFPQLSILSLTSIDQTNLDDMSTGLAACVRLVDLELSCEKLTCDHLSRCLPYMTSLRELKLYGCVNLSSLQFLTIAQTSLTHLRHFEIYRSPLIPVVEYHHLHAISLSLETLLIDDSSSGPFDPLMIASWTPDSATFQRSSWPRLKTFCLTVREE